MATTAAQDEFNNLFRDKTRINSHPADSPHQPPRSSSPAASFLEDDSASDRTPAASVRTATTTRTTTAAAAGAGGRYRVPTQRHQSNTGPKGVITDAQAFTAAARARTSTSVSRTSFQREREAAAVRTQPYVNGLHETRLDEEDDEEDDEHLEGRADDDDEFMDSWRKDRLRELQNGQRRRQGSGNGGGGGGGGGGRGRFFGGLVPVDGGGYLDAVDGSGSDTVVVVYIFDDRSEVSDLIETCVRDLARKYVNTRFVKMHYVDAEMEPAGVPAVLAYRAGEKFAGLVPVLDEIPDDADVNATTLERLFQKHQIL